jgi:hypothetical protein
LFLLTVAGQGESTLKQINSGKGKLIHSLPFFNDGGSQIWNVATSAPSEAAFA